MMCLRGPETVFRLILRVYFDLKSVPFHPNPQSNPHACILHGTLMPTPGSRSPPWGMHVPCFVRLTFPGFYGLAAAILRLRRRHWGAWVPENLHALSDPACLHHAPAGLGLRWGHGQQTPMGGVGLRRRHIRKHLNLVLLFLTVEDRP